MYNLAFSSSGVLFAAHVGVLAYLQDNKIKIKNYSGTSGGAIVACWGANNLPARELLKLTVQFGYTKFFTKFSLMPGGLFDHSVFGKTISAYCKPRKNLWIVTFNLLKMKKQIWNGENFNLSKILTATTSIPGIFKPVVYSNGLHVDGIFAKYCPDDLWNNGRTISVRLKCKNKTRSRYPFDNIVHKIEKAGLAFLEYVQGKTTRSKNIVYVEPDLNSISQLDLFSVKTKDHIEMFNRGYESAKQICNSIS